MGYVNLVLCTDQQAKLQCVVSFGRVFSQNVVFEIFDVIAQSLPADF
jgi:hypothetical protein